MDPLNTKMFRRFIKKSTLGKGNDLFTPVPMQLFNEKCNNWLIELLILLYIRNSRGVSRDKPRDLEVQQDSGRFRHLLEGGQPRKTVIREREELAASKYPDVEGAGRPRRWVLLVDAMRVVWKQWNDFSRFS